MKEINSSLQKSLGFLAFLLALLLSPQSMLAASPEANVQTPPYYNPTCNQQDDQVPHKAFKLSQIIARKAWENLQDKMAILNGNPGEGYERLLGAQVAIFDYQSTLFQSSTELNAGVMEMKLAAEMDFMNADLSNQVMLPLLLVDLGNFENTLLHARTGSTNPEAFSDVNNFYKDNSSLIQDIAENFIALQTDLLNVDPSNLSAIDQVNKDYSQSIKTLYKKAHAYKKAELQDAVIAAALTPEEQQLWNQFQSTLTAKCIAACKNYCANPTFVAFPGIEIDLQNSDPTNPAAQLQLKLEIAEAVDGTLAAFKIVKQGCLYEYLNVLLTKRNDHDSSLNSFHQLQARLDQFLNSVDLNNSIALLQAQVDMLAYEKEVAAATISK